jgi:hydroxymethylglutaryl-CoA lyase
MNPMTQNIKIIECPRDAMQGLLTFIPTEVKIAYLNQLLRIGFDTIDFGSFVSEKAVPQLRDTAQVLKALDLSQAKSKLLAIVANLRGAEDAVHFDEIAYLGFPFSISETFQKRNTNKSIEESLVQVEEIQTLCQRNKKELVVYISMGFGNPYGDPYSPEKAAYWCERLHRELGIGILALSDTIGIGQPEAIEPLFQTLIASLPTVEFGAHLHTVADQAQEKIEAAYRGGCRRFDGALRGLGGCPMASDQLTGNMPTEALLAFCKNNDLTTSVDPLLFDKALLQAKTVFPAH